MASSTFFSKKPQSNDLWEKKTKLPFALDTGSKNLNCAMLKSTRNSSKQKIARKDFAGTFHPAMLE